MWSAVISSRLESRFAVGSAPRERRAPRRRCRRALLDLGANLTVTDGTCISGGRRARQRSPRWRAARCKQGGGASLSGLSSGPRWHREHDSARSKPDSRTTAFRSCWSSTPAIVAGQSPARLTRRSTVARPPIELGVSRVRSTATRHQQWWSHWSWAPQSP